MSRKHPGYQARQQDLKKAEDLSLRLYKACNRLRKRKDAPVWLVNELWDSVIIANELTGPLKRYRDDLPEFLE